MRHVIAIVALLVGTGVAGVSAQSPHRIAADGGDIVITPIVHASVQVEHAGRVIHVDPWSGGDLSRAAPADLQPRFAGILVRQHDVRVEHVGAPVDREARVVVAPRVGE